MFKSAQNQKGFTLVELLIVIVIIGILAGIVISILDPVRQQNRARDGVVVATINKMVADVRAQAAGDISGNGALPTCTQLSSSLQNVNTANTSCPVASPDRGVVAISGVATNSGPNAVTTGTGTTSGQFLYLRSGGNFCISAIANDRSTSDYVVYDPNSIRAGGGSSLNTPNRDGNPCY